MKNILEELVRTVNHSTQNGLMTKEDMSTVINLLGRLYTDLYKSYEEFKGASTMVEEVLLTYAEEAALEAEAKKAEEIAKKALHEGVAIELVRKITGLDIEIVKNLALEDE
jgi:acyl CoA:acetate/3-ketoacid CoA transferase beta subunit